MDEVSLRFGVDGSGTDEGRLSRHLFLFQNAA
jgi:hypothetical protein